MMQDDAGDLAEGGGWPLTPAALRVLIGLMGEDLSDYAGSVRPPEELRSAVLAAPTPVLRGVVLDAAAELDRRRRGAG